MGMLMTNDPIVTEHTAATPAVIHVDLDGARHIYEQHGWQYRYPDDPLFESGMKNLLSFLGKNRLRATLFAIADSVNDAAHLELLQEAVSQGHEIASHSLTHVKLNALDYSGKRREIGESRKILEKKLNITIKGFRAPNYSIDRQCMELLDEFDYRYDSSVFPTADYQERLQVAEVPQRPHYPLQGRQLLELPLPGYKPAPFPFHPCYSLILGQGYFNWGLRRFQRSGSPLVMLFHLTDFADPLPAERLRGFKARILTLSHIPSDRKTQRCQAMLNQVTKNNPVTDTMSLLEMQSGQSLDNDPVVLAISTTHETGSALFVGSELKAAISEERMDRVKFSTQYPPKRSIREVIRVAGIDPKRIDEVIISGLPAGKLVTKLLGGQLTDFFDYHGFIDYFPHFNKALYRSFYLYRALGYRSILKHLKQEYGIEPNIHFVEHHLCHAAAAYRTAPFDDALIVTADGVGDDVSITISTGKDRKIERLKEIRYPHSFGQFYTACTQVLGFRGGRHEGKITGLSGFGKVDPELYQKVKSTIKRSGPDFKLDKRYYSEGIIRGLGLGKMKEGESLFDALQYRNYKTPLKRLLKGYPREDVATVFQQLLEEEMFKIVEPYAKQTGLRNLALCGGLFANVKLNSDLYTRLGMDQVYIFPHMGDGGLSVGAFLEFFQAQPKPFNTVFWGPEYSEAEMEAALKAAHVEGIRYEKPDNPEDRAAILLAGHKIIARFNGRMEFGPRALCNRSILYHAGDPEANKWLNKRLKRTEFMPFAPVVLEEEATNLFEEVEGKEHACQFMTIIVKCNDFTKEKCPAITHVDGTARPQFVSDDTNPGMYRILKKYHELTGIPLLVNTSFNMHEEPIVCSPHDAIRAFLSSRLDYLAMGPFLAWIDDEKAVA
jgi:carbamoyltransferase